MRHFAGPWIGAILARGPGGRCRAQRTLSWDELAVEARLDADGRLHVKETQVMALSGDWNGGERLFTLRARPGSRAARHHAHRPGHRRFEDPEPRRPRRRRPVRLGRRPHAALAQPLPVRSPVPGHPADLRPRIHLHERPPAEGRRRLRARSRLRLRRASGHDPALHPRPHPGSGVDPARSSAHRGRGRRPRAGPGLRDEARARLSRARGARRAWTSGGQRVAVAALGRALRAAAPRARKRHGGGSGERAASMPCRRRRGSGSSRTSSPSRRR